MTERTSISKSGARDLAGIRQQIDAARDHVHSAHRGFARRGEGMDLAAAPYLDRCAQELEDLARMCRSAADQVVSSQQLRS